MKPGKTGVIRIVHATRYSWDGLKAAWQHEAAFRQEVCLALPLFILSFFLPVSAAEQSMLIATLFFVMIVELLNSAIEAVVDRIDSSWHELSKRAKDIGSAAVMLALTASALVWLIILVPKLL